MKINALHIDGFGVWKNLSLEEFGDGLTLIYGPNEAGKTTLLEFIRSMLYGYNAAGRGYLPPVEGGTGGGWLDVDAGDHFRVQRRFDPAREIGSQGELLVSSPGAGELPPHRLADMLGGVDESVYRNVFAIGLREIQELGVLGDTEAAEMLYRLAAGMDRVSLLDVVRDLRTPRERLLDPESGQGQLVELRGQWQRLRGELEEQSKLTQRYGRLQSERTQLEREVERLEAEAEQLERQARLVELAGSLQDRFNRRAELDAELTALGPVRQLPEGAIDRLDQLNDRLAQHRQRGRAIQQERQRLKEEFAGLKVNAELWRQAPRIDALKEQQNWVDGLERRVAELQAEVGQLDEGLHARRDRIGVPGDRWTPAELPVVSSRTLAALRPAARAVRQCRAKLEQIRREGEDAKQTAEALTRQIDAALADRGYSDLSVALDDVGGRVAQLRRRQQTDERLQEMTAYRDDLEQQNRRLIDRQPLPLPLVAGFGLLFILGVMLVLVALVAGPAAWVSMTAAVWVGMFGAVGVVGASLGRVVMERTNDRRLESCRRQIELLGAQIEQTGRERDALDAALSADGAPLENRLEITERELESLEELVPLESRRNTARQDAHAALGRINLAEQELKKAHRRWREALRNMGLPPNLKPRQVKQLGSEFDQVRQLSHRAEAGREELAARRRELETFHDRVRQLVRDCGVSPSSTEPREQLEELAALVVTQEARLTRRRRIRRRAKKLKRKAARHAAAVRSLGKRRQSLLRKVGASDEQQFRHRALEIARVDVLRRDRDALDREIRAALGDSFSEEELAAQYDGSAAELLDARLEQLLERHENVESRRKERLEARGRLGEQLRAMADDRRIIETRMELASVEKRLEDAADRWRVLAVTSHVLDSIRNEYERNRQPEALRAASGYLERFTEGRYRRVWTPLGEDVLRVEDAEQHELPVDALSRGTREQLFLSLRLALAGCYARRGVSLPLVLDDVLVNFDAARAKAAARTLRDFAGSGHQLLVFTCHEHIVKLFRPLKVQITELPDRFGGNRSSITVAPSAPKKRRKPKKAAPSAKPEPEPPPEPVAEQVVAEPPPVEERKPAPVERPKPRTPSDTYNVVEPPAVVRPPVEDFLEDDYDEPEFELVEPAEPPPEEAEEDSVDPIVDECSLIDETKPLDEGWFEEEEPDDELPAPEEEEDAYEQFDDTAELEDGEKEDEQWPLSETDSVFDADYFDSRDAVDELEEDDWEEVEEEEEGFEYGDEEEDNTDHEEEVLEDEDDEGYEEVDAADEEYYEDEEDADEAYEEDEEDEYEDGYDEGEEEYEYLDDEEEGEGKSEAA